MDSRGVQQAEHAVLAFRYGEGEGHEHGSAQLDPVSGGVHLVLGQFQLARADVLEGEELDLLETDYLRSHQHVAVGAERGAGDTLLMLASSGLTWV